MPVVFGVIVMGLFIASIILIEKKIFREPDPIDPTSVLPRILAYMTEPEWEESRQQLTWLAETRLPQLSDQLAGRVQSDGEVTDHQLGDLPETYQAELRHRIDKIHSLFRCLEFEIQTPTTFLDPADIRLFIAETYCRQQP